MRALEANNNLPNQHTRGCVPSPPPPSPPPRAPPAVCEVPAPSSPPTAPSSLCYDRPLIENRYFDEHYLITQGPAPQVVGDCPAWCAAQVESECEARVAFQLGETFGCGFDPGVSRCSLFAADTLVIISTTGLWAVDLQCSGLGVSTPRLRRPRSGSPRCAHHPARLLVPVANRWTGQRRCGGAAVRRDQRAACLPMPNPDRGERLGCLRGRRRLRHLP